MYNFYNTRRFLKTEGNGRCTTRQSTKNSFSVRKDRFKTNNYTYNFNKNSCSLRKERKLPSIRRPQIKSNSPTIQAKTYLNKFGKTKPIVKNNNRKIFPEYKFKPRKIDTIIYKCDLPSITPKKYTKKYKYEPVSQNFINRIGNLKKIPPINPKVCTNLKRMNTSYNNCKIRQNKLSTFAQIIKKNNINYKYNTRFSSRDSFIRPIKNNLGKSSPIRKNPTKNNSLNKSLPQKNSPKPHDDKNLQILEFMTTFYEKFVEIYNSYPNNDNFSELVQNFNKTFIYLFDITIFPKTKICEVFLRTYKYCCIFVVCLIFISKDDTLIKNTKNFKNNFGFFLYEAINIFPYKIYDSEKINTFMKKYMFKDETNIKNILINLIKLSFPENDNNSELNNNNSYNMIKNCLNQLLNNIQNETPGGVLIKLNESILYNYNCQYFIEEYEKPKKKRVNEESKEKNKNKGPKKAPFISKKPEKNYTLVLDLDETLVHNLILNFGTYFLVRPGVFKFLRNIHEYYEIIIFTAGNRTYASGIIDRIDVNDYISHRLFKSHVIYEDGVPVKKLDLIGRDLNKLIFVDNLEATAKYNSKNFCPISSWYNNIYDDEISKLETKLINIVKSGKYEEDITKGLVEEK